MNYLLVLDVSSKIRELVEQGLEILINPENAVTSIIIQLIATLILFLAVKYLLWNKITAVLEKKEENERKAFTELENAKEEAENIRKQILIEEQNAKQEGYQIIERAKQKSYIEAEEIVKKAQIDANMRLDEAKEQIQKEVANANESIKKEIIDIAYILAEKIINEEIDESKYDNLINEFIKKEENR